MKELVVISGKGGTGKTSLLGAFATMAEGAVLADADVDAADLYLLLSPEVLRRETFVSGHVARILAEKCCGCQRCEKLCRFEAVRFDGPGNDVIEKTYRVDRIACEGCGLCQLVCPAEAVSMEEAVCGEWYVSRTRCGPMVHARLGIAAENSGKLVSLVREQARRVAQEQRRDLLLVDGPPGIGCPVIASITGSDMVLIVAEPTLSGLHDLKRVADLADHFAVPASLVVNKFDLNEELTRRIEKEAAERKIASVGRVRFDPAVTKAQLRAKAVVEFATNGAAEDVRNIWTRVRGSLAALGSTKDA